MVSKASFKNGSLLLLTCFVSAVAASAFWGFLGERAVAVLTLIVIATLWLDNRGLRRQPGDKPPSIPEQR